MSAIPNSLPERGDPEIEIYGMEGIPEKDIKERRQKLAQMSQGGDDDEDDTGTFSYSLLVSRFYIDISWFCSIKHFRSAATHKMVSNKPITVEKHLKLYY